MTPELVARVDAWLASRSGSALARRWFALASMWADQRRSALRYLVAPGLDPSGSEGDLEDDAEATAAAMRGVLLELVRCALGVPGLSVASHPSGVVALWRVLAHGEVLRIDGRVAWATEDEALVVALEAAPQRESST